VKRGKQKKGGGKRRGRKGEEWGVRKRGERAVGKRGEEEGKQIGGGGKQPDSKRRKNGKKEVGKKRRWGGIFEGVGGFVRRACKGEMEKRRAPSN